jgi:hypothetical protein
MANILAPHAVGASLATYLANAYPAELRARHPASFRLMSAQEMNQADDLGTTLTLFLYRVTVNEHLRNVRPAHVRQNENAPLSLDLHYLLTVWADGALAEHTLLAWAMRELYLHPVLSLSSLSPEAEWNASDAVQIVPAELSTEDLMRIWDALTPPYRLSVSYIARMVRIDAERIPDDLPVVASRLAFQTETETEAVG